MILPFTRTPLRALVIIPGDHPSIDYCRLVAGGWPIDGGVPGIGGPLQLVLRKAKDDPRGLPVTIHPECERRAAA